MIPLLADLGPLPSLAEAAASTALGWRWGLGAASVLLLLYGARMSDRGVRLAVLASVVELGHIITSVTEDSSTLEGHAWVVGGTVAMLAALVLWLAEREHRLALVFVGVMVGAHAANGSFGWTASSPSVGWAHVAVGAAAVPFLFEPFALFMAPAVGALGLTWALQRPETPEVVVLVWGLAVLLQLFMEHREPEAGTAPG